MMDVCSSAASERSRLSSTRLDSAGVQIHHQFHRVASNRGELDLFTRRQSSRPDAGMRSAQ